MNITKKATSIQFDFDEVAEILVDIARRSPDLAYADIRIDFMVEDIHCEGGNFTIYIVD